MFGNLGLHACPVFIVFRLHSLRYCGIFGNDSTVLMEVGGEVKQFSFTIQEAEGTDVALRSFLLCPVITGPPFFH